MADPPRDIASAHSEIPGMTVTLVILFMVHGRQREDEREKRLQYWREQVIVFSHLRNLHHGSPVLRTHRTLSVGTFYRCMKQPKPP